MKTLKLYVWSSISPQGKKLHGEIQAYHLNHAKLKLKQQGINPLFLRKKRNSLLKQIHGISHFDIAIFFRQLATLITAGIPLIKCFDILHQTQEKIQFRILLATIKNEIENGKNLADGLYKFPKYFDELSYHLINAGELTGTLDIMLKRVADHKEKTLALKKQIKHALFYPTLIFIVAIFVSMIMCVFIVPRFAELFQQMHGKLPAFTKFVITFSTYLRESLWLIIALILSLCFFIYFFRKSSKMIKYRDYLILKIPIFGNTIKHIILARFGRSLTTAFSAGVPIINALQITANLCGNQSYLYAVNGLKSEVLNGIQLHKAMQANRLFPPFAVQLVKIGEESGTLEHMLDKMAETYETSVDSLIKNLSNLLEPLIMITLGVLIGGLIIAMYLPIFKLGTLI